MKKKEFIAYIQTLLDELYPYPKPPLLHKDPYTLLIAVLLSARSTDKKVNEVTPDLFKLADTPEKMVRLRVEEIQAIIKPCGLSPQKAKSIHTLSQILIDKYHCKVPISFEALEELPGVGHKTASVVMAQAFNVPAFPVDTHIYRLARRWGLSKGKSVEKVEEDLKKIFPKSKWINLHLQIIFFARAFCKAQKHDSKTCLICKLL
jgi:endonuclease-3